MTAGKFKVIILIPVFERQQRKGCGIGELQVGKVPIEDLAISRGQVHVTATKSTEN